MWVRWVLVVLVALLCTGCELRLEVEAEFDRHASGRLRVAMAADADLRGQAAAAGADPLGDLAASGQELGGGWRVDDTIGEDGVRTVALSVGFDGPEEFDALAADLADALAAPEGDVLAALTVAVDDERMEVIGSAGLQPTEAVADYGLAPDEVVALLRQEGGFAYSVRVVLPGEVVDSSATHAEGRTLSWAVAPGEQVAIRAVGVRPGPPVWPLVVAAVLGLAFAALVLRRLVVIRRGVG